MLILVEGCGASCQHLAVSEDRERLIDKAEHDHLHVNMKPLRLPMGRVFLEDCDMPHWLSIEEVEKL
jgi:hypothetical protein